MLVSAGAGVSSGVGVSASDVVSSDACVSAETAGAAVCDEQPYRSPAAMHGISNLFFIFFFIFNIPSLKLLHGLQVV